MRLLIAGILSLVIYLMTCGHGEEETEKTMRKMNSCEQHFNEKMNQFYHFISHPYHFNSDFQFPYMLEKSNRSDIQTFPNV